MALVDLKELSSRESERVEWKENVADTDNVIKTIVAFANDISNLGGGYVVCGAKEGKDEAGFQKLQLTGLTSSRLKEIENKIFSDCRDKVDPPVILLSEEVPIADPEKRVLVFIIPSTGHAHSYRSSGKDASTYYIRIGRETREARNGLLRELLVNKKVLDPWDRRINPNATIADIDLIIFRDHLQQMGLWDQNKSLEDYISDSERLSAFVPPLAGKEQLTGVIRPRNFTLLMFGKTPTQFFPGAFSIFSIYRGKDRSEPTAERIEIIGTIAEQARKLIELIDVESYTAFDKNDPNPNQVKYPKRALHEALINAIVHRDYESEQPVRVTVFSDRIVITSPGTLARTIDPTSFKEGKSSPYWKNQTLAYFFNKLQLAQSEGQGIPTILKTMRDEGCPAPIFEIMSDNLTCILPAHPRHELLRDLAKIENSIILGEHAKAKAHLEELLDKDPYNFRTIELYCEVLNLDGDPKRLYQFVSSGKMVIEKLNSGTLILVAETLMMAKNDINITEYAHQLLLHAMKGRLEENEIKRVAINLRKGKNDETAIDFLNDVFVKNPILCNNHTLLDIRAKASIDLAKKCLDTAKMDNISYVMKGKAWDKCRLYLLDAEKDLNNALHYVNNETDKEYIMRDIDFLRTMKEISRKPERKEPTESKEPTERKGSGKKRRFYPPKKIN